MDLVLPSLSPGSDGPARLTCSARGCRADAAWGLRWNNPRLHTPERRKTWLACDTHRPDLEGFLGVRGFHRETVPVADLADDGDHGDDGDGTGS